MTDTNTPTPEPLELGEPDSLAGTFFDQINALKRDLAARERYIADLHDTMDKAAAIVGSKPRDADDLLAKLAARDAELTEANRLVAFWQQSSAEWKASRERLDAELARVLEELASAEEIIGSSPQTYEQTKRRAERAEAELAQAREELVATSKDYTNAHRRALSAEAERDAAVKDAERKEGFLRTVEGLIADDAYAMSFQSLGQYRTALIGWFDEHDDAAREGQ